MKGTILFTFLVMIYFCLFVFFYFYFTFSFCIYFYFRFSCYMFLFIYFVYIQFWSILVQGPYKCPAQGHFSLIIFNTTLFLSLFISCQSLAQRGHIFPHKQIPKSAVTKIGSKHFFFKLSREHIIKSSTKFPATYNNIHIRPRTSHWRI